MSGAAWKPKNKTTEELFQELVIMKNEYYDLEVDTVDFSSNALYNTNISHKCYGSTSVSKTESVGSTPTCGANGEVAESG